MQNRPQTCNKARDKDLSLAVNKDTTGAEFTYFDSNCTVYLRAVLLKECVGTKSDTLLTQTAGNSGVPAVGRALFGLRTHSRALVPV
jgi:hypothetical protein